MPPRAAGDTFEQTSMRSVPSACMTSNLRSARSKARLRCGSGMPSKSRKGWKAVTSRPASRTIRPTGGVGEKIILEDFDALEPRSADRVELLLQVAGKGNGGNAGPHRSTVNEPVRSQ